MIGLNIFFRKMGAPLLALVAGLMFCSCCASPFIYLVYECNRINSPPIIEVYPDSELREQSIERTPGGRNLLKLGYSTNADFEEVVAYFSQHLDCRIIADQSLIRCQGIFPDIEEYVVDILHDDLVRGFAVYYHVVISWKRCEWRLQL